MASRDSKQGFLANVSMESNAIERLKQKRLTKGLSVLDLTCANPTKHRYIFPPAVLQKSAESYFSSRCYAPDPKGMLPAREVLSDYYRQQRNYGISSNDIVITASTSESYRFLFSLLADPGDNFLAPEVTYPLFDFLAQTGSVELKPYRMIEGEEWQIDYEHLCSQVDVRTRAVLLISPHNPAGIVLKEPSKGLAEKGLPLICDEVFAHFVDDGAAPPLGGMYPEQPVFHLNGISKMFALPDLKLGWIAMNEAASAQYRDRLEVLNDCFLSASSLVQFMLPDLFEYGMGFCREMAASVRRTVKHAEERLRSMPCMKVPVSEGGAFVFARVEGWGDEEDLVLRLLEKGVLVHPGYFYGCEDGAHIMISCMPEIGEIEEGISIIQTMIDK